MAPSMLLRNGTLLLHQQNDVVKAARRTDLLIEGDRISAIGADLKAPDGSNIMDCSGKIISPGFIDTHHHLWQTQLKGRHADQELLQYMASGNIACFCFDPEDMFWGQLSAALEAIDVGTTFVLDHSHGSYSAEHAQRVMDGTVASGIRAVIALSAANRLEKWDDKTIKPNLDIFPDYVMEKIGQWSKLAGKEGIHGRIYAGLGFDLFFLPKETVQHIWARAKQLNVKLITSHVCRNALFGFNSTVKLLQSYDLLKGPEKGGIKWVPSHTNGLDKDDLRLLATENQYLSSTPESEAQMALGTLNVFEPGVKGSLGVDSNAINSSSILLLARTALQLKRQETNQRVLDQGGAPLKIRGSTEEAFNLATINGARAVGMEQDIGSLAVGKKADIVIVDYDNSVSMLCAGDYDPVVSLLRHSDARDIDTVIIDGVVRKEKGKLLDVDINGNKTSWKDVARKTRESQAMVLKRAENLNYFAAQHMFKQLWHIEDSKLFDVD